MGPLCETLLNVGDIHKLTWLVIVLYCIV